MSKWDASLYPDVDMPDMDNADKYDRADYLHRFCSDADWGIVPLYQHVQAFATKEWKTVFDEFPVITSGAYHALRELFGWEPINDPEFMPDRPIRLRWVKRAGRGERVFQFPE